MNIVFCNCAERVVACLVWLFVYFAFFLAVEGWLRFVCLVLIVVLIIVCVSFCIVAWFVVVLIVIDWLLGIAWLDGCRFNSVDLIYFGRCLLLVL